METIDKQFCDFLMEGNFKEFMILWKNQFDKYGKLGGKIVLPLNTANQKDVEGLLGTSFHNKSQAIISWVQLKKAISKTKYDPCDFTHVLELYFNEKLVTQKTLREEKQDKTMTMFRNLQNMEWGNHSRQWLDHIIKSQDKTYILALQNINNDLLFNDFVAVLKAIDNLPLWHNDTQSLAVFAANITGNPHAFDNDTSLITLLLHGISFIQDIKLSSTSLHEKNDLLLSVGLYKNDINNYCSIYGLKAYVNQNIHDGWNGFFEAKESWNVNISNVMNIDSIDTSITTKVYIIENPSIFQVLVQKVIDNSLDYIGLVCSLGQPVACVYALLNKIYDTNIELWYCGDFDPEGLLIAQKLLTKYKTMHLWLYESQYYYIQQSDEYSTPNRLKKLKHLTDPQLVEIGNLIKINGNGYQENMIEVYLDNIR